MVYVVTTTLSSLYSGSERIVRRAWFHFLLWTHFNISDKTQSAVFIHQYNISLWVSNVTFDALTLMVGISGIQINSVGSLSLLGKQQQVLFYVLMCFVILFNFCIFFCETWLADSTGRFFWSFLFFFYICALL